MPKMKTRRAIAKRFRFTARGKIKRAQAFRSHLLTGRGANRMRRLRRAGLVDKTDQERIRRVLPYGST
jgi:large subunit ribosomal protein L35